MNFSRRQFVKGGVTAFTFGFAAPQMLCDIALAQGVPARNLVVVYLSGGNDSLSTVIPYRDPANFFQRYSWPIEFVVKAIKETGWTGFSVASAMTPLSNMGQQLFEPPDVNGWALGPEWISTSSMLSRMNFASMLAGNQRFNLARDAQPYRQAPELVLEYMLARFRTMGYSAAATTAMQEYLRSTAWTGTDAQLRQRVPGLTRLIVGSGEYQFN